MNTKDIDLFGKNTVSSKEQLKNDEYVSFYMCDNACLKVLFVGNSITRHKPKDSIGWNGDWGMAASCKENDYVHRIISLLERDFGSVSYCITGGSLWENDYMYCHEIAEKYYKKVRDFSADLIIMRIGENVNREKNSQISCKPYYKELIEYLCADNTKQVIITDCFWKEDKLDTSFYEVAAENGYTFCQIHDLAENEENMAIGLFDHEGVSIHPGDLGMSRIAERIYSKVKIKDLHL